MAKRKRKKGLSRRQSIELRKKRLLEELEREAKALEPPKPEDVLERLIKKMHQYSACENPKEKIVLKEEIITTAIQYEKLTGTTILKRQKVEHKEDTKQQESSVEGIFKLEDKPICSKGQKRCKYPGCNAAATINGYCDFHNRYEKAESK